MNNTPQIHWNNIVAAVIGLGALIFLLRHRHEAAGFLAAAERIGPGNSPQDMTTGLLAIGICGVALVAIIRLLIRNRRD